MMLINIAEHFLLKTAVSYLPWTEGIPPQDTDIAEHFLLKTAVSYLPWTEGIPPHDADTAEHCLLGVCADHCDSRDRLLLCLSVSVDKQLNRHNSKQPR